MVSLATWRANLVLVVTGSYLGSFKPDRITLSDDELCFDDGANFVDFRRAGSISGLG